MKVVLPSGREWEVRETNGDDDATLSRTGGSMSGESLNAFIANIIIGPERPLAADIKKWLIADKYWLLFKQRIFNLGNELKFPYVDPADPSKTAIEITEDLNEIPEFKYPNGDATELEFITPQGNKFKFTLKTSLTEDAEELLNKSDINKNTPLLTRNLHWWNQGKWEKATSFRHFSSKEMVYIRSYVDKNDPDFNPMVTFKSDFTGRFISIPLMSISTFYFPEEMI